MSSENVCSNYFRENGCDGCSCIKIIRVFAGDNGCSDSIPVGVTCTNHPELPLTLGVNFVKYPAFVPVKD
jgi:hypothetical protein